MDSDVIVIGGGIAGLVAATEAARAGCSVQLFEANDALGGRARTRTVAGYRFNQGPHALYRGGRLMQVLEGLGAPPAGRAPKLRRGLAVTAAKARLLPFTASAIARTGLLNSQQKAEIRVAFRALLGEIPALAGETVDGYFARLGLKAQVRASLEALVRVTTYCHAPGRMDAAAAFEQVRLGFGGVMYLHDGWEVIVSALAAAAQAAGVPLVSGQPALEVRPEADGVTVRFADGRTRTAAAAILAVEPARARDLAPTVPSLAAAAARARPVRSACLDLALSALPNARRTYALGVEAPLYFSVHSAAARLTPGEGALIHVARYLGDGEAPGRDVIAELERLVDRLQPGWRTLETARQRIPAMIVAHDFPQAAHGGRAGRANVEVRESHRLFLAGDWVGPDGLLADAAAASAVAAAEAAVRIAR